MRALVWVSVGLAAALGACSQSLSGNLTGTGGAGALTGSGTGAGGTVGNATGGAGASNTASCQTLSAEYAAALRDAQTCDVGASGQCKQRVIGWLSVCGSCPTFVTDASKLNAIQQLWQAARCDSVSPAPPCVSPQCPVIFDANVCVATDGGRGTCSYVAGTGGNDGTGGAVGTGGSSATGGSSPDGGELDLCGAYANKYTTVLSTVKSCTFGAAGQCAHSVLTFLSVCATGCNTYVNDSTELDQIRLLWEQAGCNKVAVACPAIACAPAAGGVCSQTDGGGGTCLSTYNVLR